MRCAFKGFWFWFNQNQKHLMWVDLKGLQKSTCNRHVADVEQVCPRVQRVKVLATGNRYQQGDV
jgi:hypothetical protein